MSAVSRMTAPLTPIQHAAWCRDHMYELRPEDGWCRGERMVIGGLETYLTGDYDANPGIYVSQVEEPDELSPETMRILMARLKQLVKAAEAS